MGIFLAVGHDGSRIVSRDRGATWGDAQKGRAGEVYRGICVGGNLAVAFGSYGGDGIFAVTGNGSEWKTAKYDAKYSKYVLGMVYANGAFHGYGGDRTSVGAAAVFVMTSVDGVQWSDLEGTSPDNTNFYRIAFDGKWYVGVGQRGRRAMSVDGKKWVDAPDSQARLTLIDIAYGNGIFVGVGLHGLRMTTRDGVTWSKPMRGEEGEHLNSVLWTGNMFVAVGLGATYLSTDGDKWERKPNINAPTAATYGNGLFVGTKWKGRILISTDGIKWDEVYKHPVHLESVGYLG